MRKVVLVKLSWYSHYMDFPGNTFAVQGQSIYMLYLQQKIHGTNFCALLKSHENCESLAQKKFTCLQYLKSTSNCLCTFSTKLQSFTVFSGSTP